jgi:hypothetical protein
MSKHDVALFVGAAVIGMAAFRFWGDFFGTAATILVGCTIWVVLIQRWDTR